VIGSVLGALIFAHGLPPYRPLFTRLKRADAVGLVRITAHQRRSVSLQPMRSITGRVPLQANYLPGHRLPRSARHGLATFRRTRGHWVIQEQNREWVELPPQADGGTALVKWIETYRKSPREGLRLGVRSPVLRPLATRDLVFRLHTERSQQWVMLALTLLLDPAIDDADTRSSIERAAQTGRDAAFRKDFSACVTSRDLLTKACRSVRTRLAPPRTRPGRSSD
jgi:hypothetical protein